MSSNANTTNVNRTTIDLYTNASISLDASVSAGCDLEKARAKKFHREEQSRSLRSCAGQIGSHGALLFIPGKDSIYQMIYLMEL